MSHSWIRFLAAAFDSLVYSTVGCVSPVGTIQRITSGGMSLVNSQTVYTRRQVKSYLSLPPITLSVVTRVEITSSHPVQLVS